MPATIVLFLRSTACDFGLALIGVHVPRLAANERLVGFDLAGELVERSGVHCVPDALKHEPRGPLHDAQVTGDLVGTDAVLAIGNKEHRAEPLVQTEGRILKDSPDLDRELLFAVQALPHEPGAEERGALGLAPRAYRNAIIPAKASEELNAGKLVGEIFDRFD